MAIIIAPVNDKRFSVNNIQYLKNYITAVHGNRIEIFNCYERSDVLVPLSHYSNFRVSGVVYPNALALQAALLPLLYSRGNMGGGGPDIDQDNLDVVKYVRSASANTESILAAINSVETYTLDDKQSLWFIVVVPGIATTNGRITNPYTYKYKVVNQGKGTYGLEAYLLTPDNIELMYTATASARDIAMLPDTDVVSYGSITSSIRTWFTLSNRRVKSRSEGYTIFQGMLSGVDTPYLWIGGDNQDYTGLNLPTTSDFLALNSITVATDQDNLDIKKNFTLENREHNKTIALDIINNLPPYAVNEKQSVWYVGSQRTQIFLGEPGIPRNQTVPPLNPLVVKYKMLNKGKGIYGAGHTQLTVNDIELIYNNEATLNDLESVATTNVISFTLSTGQSISNWLNNQLPAVAIQPQADGYTIFKSALTSSDFSYLWIGEDGNYGVTGLQSEPEDFQLINETVPPVDQDNIDIKKTFTLPTNFTTANVLSKINSLLQFTVSEKQSVWFVGQSIQPIREIGSPSPMPVLICKYKMLNKGKGTYGRGGTQLRTSDIELIYTNEASLQDVESSAQTDIITVALNEEETISQWLNRQAIAVALQPQEDGYTIFKDPSGNEVRSWLWVGRAGNYGSGLSVSNDTDFQILNNTSPAPFVPALQQVVAMGNGVYDFPVEFNSGTEQLTVNAVGLSHKDTYKVNNIRFENGTAQNTNDVTLTIPAKATNDVFAMQSEIHKPVKIITTASDGFDDGTYILQPEDRDKWLMFKVSSDFFIKIPEATFAANTLIEGETADIGQATFIESEGMILHHGASELPKTAEMNSVFGLKFRNTLEVSLFGKLKLL